MRQKIIDFIKEQYNAVPEYLWRRYPTFCVFRHYNNNKWFGIMMTVPCSVIGLSGKGTIDIINVKTDNVEFLRGVAGILPAYHMNKATWVSVILDGTVSEKNVRKLIEMSYGLTAQGKNT